MPIRRLLLTLPVGIALAAAAPRVNAAPPYADAVIPAAPTICRLVENAAAANRLPVAYLTRLLWTESGFSAAATSPAGAEGIAQFMPGTAAERGLTDPRDPAASIAQAARLLVDLDRRFGNLGLAAAAYNAGPARLARWLRTADFLPMETRLYVRMVTGSPVEQWVERDDDPVAASTGQSCAALVAELERSGDRLHNPLDTLAAPPVSIAPGGEMIARRTGRPVTVAVRLSLHRLLDRAVGRFSSH